MRQITLAVFLITTCVTALMLSRPVLAFDPFQAVCNPTNSATQSSTLCQGANQSDPTQNPLTGKNGLLRGIANVIAITAGLAAVIIIIVSGFRFITSGGDAAKAKSAREAIVGAIIGLVIIALADSIISFVIGRL